MSKKQELKITQSIYNEKKLVIKLWINIILKFTNM